MTAAPAGFAERWLTLPEGEVAALFREGKGGTLIVAHANGLNAGAYAPLLERLGTELSILAPDLRGHGRTSLSADPDALRSWWPYAGDLTAIARQAEGPVTVLGHSLGAVSSLLAASSGLRADRLLLVEPVILPRVVRLIARTPLRGPIIRRRGIAAKATRRRAAWPDRAALRDVYAANPFFASWDEAALDGYLGRGVTGDGPVRLACEPAWEAASFAAQAHRFWSPLRAVLRAGVPVHVLAAAGRSTVPGWARDRLRAAGAMLTEAPGGHLLPQEAPEAASAWANRVLGGV